MRVLLLQSRYAEPQLLPNQIEVHLLSPPITAIRPALQMLAVGWCAQMWMFSLLCLAGAPPGHEDTETERREGHL